jgi:hypothetical protein
MELGQGAKLIKNRVNITNTMNPWILTKKCDVNGH